MLRIPCVEGWLGTQGLAVSVQPPCPLHSSLRTQQLAAGSTGPNHPVREWQLPPDSRTVEWVFCLLRRHCNCRSPVGLLPKGVAMEQGSLSVQHIVEGQ